MEEAKHSEITTRIKSIDLLKFETQNIDAHTISTLDPANFGFEYTLKGKANETLSTITVECDMRIYPTVEKKLLLGEISTKMGFDAFNLEAVVKESGGIPETLTAMLFGVILSTTRGILYSEAKNTFLRNTIFPIIDLSQFLSKPVETKK